MNMVIIPPGMIELWMCGMRRVVVDDDEFMIIEDEEDEDMSVLEAALASWLFDTAGLSRLDEGLATTDNDSVLDFCVCCCCFLIACCWTPLEVATWVGVFLALGFIVVEDRRRVLVVFSIVLELKGFMLACEGVVERGVECLADEEDSDEWAGKRSEADEVDFFGVLLAKVVVLVDAEFGCLIYDGLRVLDDVLFDGLWRIISREKFTFRLLGVLFKVGFF